jgi:hypothetical protein
LRTRDGREEEEEAGTKVPAFSFAERHLPEWDDRWPPRLSILNIPFFQSGIIGNEKLSGGAKCLPEGTSTISITTHVASSRTDTPDARRRAVSFDALRRRLLLCGEVPKQSAAFKSAGQRTAGNEAGGTAGAAHGSRGDHSRVRRIDPSYPGAGHGAPEGADSLSAGPVVRIAVSRRSAAANGGAHCRQPQ